MVGAWLKANAAAVALLVVAAGAGTAAVVVPSKDDNGGGGGGDSAFCDPAEEAFGSGVTLETLNNAVMNGLMDEMLTNAPNSEVEDDLSTLSQAIVEQNVDQATAEAAAADLVTELNSLCDLDLTPITTTTSSSTSSSTTSSATTSATTQPTTTSTTTTTTTTTTTSTPPPT